MSPSHFLLATIILCFTGFTFVVQADTTNSLTISTASAIDSFGPGRNLRTNNEMDSEERVNIPVLSSIVAKLSPTKETSKWAQIDDWLDRFWSPEQVKTGLKLGSKFGDSLKKSSNYKFYKAYLAKFEGTLGVYLSNKYSTYEIWSMLGLKTTPSNLLKQAEELKVYAKYVNMVDDKTILANKLPKPELLDLHLPQSRLEFHAKLWVRTKKKRSEDFVKASLGLPRKTGNDFTDHVNYRYFKEYIDDISKLTLKEYLDSISKVTS